MSEVIAGRFTLEHIAGRGGMGEVWRAKDALTGKPAAVKLLVSEMPDFERFEREAQVLATVEHPGVVRYLAHGDAGDGRRYLAMEWLDGEDLSSRLARGPLSLAEAVTVIRQAASALAAVHQLGVIHRDVKPQNLFLVGKRLDEVRLLDFGIARRPDAKQAPLTRTGVLMGTPNYMPPEQVRGLKALDARADVYALGCVLFECLTAQAPFIGEHVMAVLARVLLEECPRLSARLPDVPAALDALVVSMTAKQPDARPRDARALLELLETVPLDASAHVVAGARLTAREQRLICVVAGGHADDGKGTEETLPPDARLKQVQGLEAVAARFGGQLEPVPGGAFFVCFVGAMAATDQVNEATRCALALRELVPEHGLIIATGRALLEEGRVPLGEVVDRAAAGLATAPRGVITVDSLSAALLDGRFLLTPTPTGATVSGERPAGEAEEVRPLLGMATPFVGRERELSVIEALLMECTSDPGARAALVTAPAGYGKTRLRTELVRRLRHQHGELQTDSGGAAELELLLGRGEPQRQDTAHALLTSALRKAFSLDDGMPAPLRIARVHERVARHFQGAALEQTSAFLSELFGDAVSETDRPWLAAPRRDPRLMAEQIRRAFCDWVLAESRAHPLVLVLEDLHWSDASTVRLVDAALRHAKDQPFFVLALARPEVTTRFPKLWAERGLHHVPLGELRARAAEQLVRKVLGERASDALVTRLVERAAGNAFYLEELIRQVAEGGDAERLPESVVAMAQLRLEGLSAEQRALLRAASVFGEVFWERGVAALTQSAGVGASLRELVDAEVVVERPQPRFATETEYAFRHALLRDAAYAMMTERDRASGHRLAAAWLETAGDRDYGALAKHYQLGEDLVAAARCFSTAAELAVERDDLPGAERLANEAEAAGAKDESHERVLSVRMSLSRWQSQDVSLRHATLLLDTAKPGSVRWCRALGDASLATPGVSTATVGDVAALQTRYLCTDPLPGAEAEYVICGARLASHFAIMRTLSPAEALARASQFAVGFEDDAAVGAAMAEARGFLDALELRIESALGHFRRAMEFFERAQDGRNHAVQVVNLGFASRALGRLAEIEPLVRGAAEAAEQHGWLRVLQPALLLGMETRFNLGDFESALRDSKRLGLLPLTHDATFQRAYMLAMGLRITCVMGLHDDARAMLADRGPLAAMRELNRSAIVRHLAWVLLELGEPEGTLDMLSSTAPLVVTMFDDLLHFQETSWLHARALLQLKRRDEGVAALKRALGAFEAARQNISVANHPQFNAVPSHQHLFALARNHGLTLPEL